MARRFTAWQRLGLPMLAGYVAANYLMALLMAVINLLFPFPPEMDPDPFRRTRMVQRCISVLVSPIQTPARLITNLISIHKFDSNLLFESVASVMSLLVVLSVHVVLGLPVFFLVRRLMRRRYRRATGRCVECGYDLTGLTGPCASCARPDDRTTTTFTPSWLDRGPSPLFQFEHSISGDVPVMKRVVLPGLIAYALACYVNNASPPITCLLDTVLGHGPNQNIPLLVRVMVDWLTLPLTNVISLIDLVLGPLKPDIEALLTRYWFVTIIEKVVWFFYYAIPLFYVSRWLVVARDRRQRGVCVTCGCSLADGSGQCLSCNPTEQEQSTLVQTIALGENHDSATGATSPSE